MRLPLVAYLFVIAVAAVGAIRSEQAINVVERTNDQNELRSCLRLADRNAKLTETTDLIGQTASVVAHAQTPPDSRTTRKLDRLVNESEKLQHHFILPPECKELLF